VPDRHVDHLLIGGGVAAVACAETLREEGALGSLALVSRELDLPYHRPPVSKGYLAGRETREDAQLHPRGWYDDAGIELLTRTSVLALDPATRVARLSTKEEVGYGTALLATGAMVRRLQVEGAQLEGIHHLRALGNADAVRADADSAERVVCVGGSYIGCEVAASLSTMGRRCTILMLEAEPMVGGFGTHVGRYVRVLLENRGVEVIGRSEVSHFLGGERVEQVVLKDGRQFPADVVVCGTGAVPDVMLAGRAGLPIGALGGIACDSRLQTGFEGLFVAGDACEYESVLHGGPARIEHERVAQAQGRVAARNMLGADLPYEEVPYFWSDLADWATLEYVGLGSPWDDEVLVGEPASGVFSAFQMTGGRLVGAVTVGRHTDLDDAARLIAAAEMVDPERLAAVSSGG
jgi:3-phenylpropionate/trans-cinnamate dioxygenase ferredoxin reductase component